MNTRWCIPPGALVTLGLGSRSARELCSANNSHGWMPELKAQGRSLKSSDAFHGVIRCSMRSVASGLSPVTGGVGCAQVLRVGDRGDASRFR